MSLFGTSGIRRLFDRELVVLAFKVGMAVGKTCGRAVVGRDTRTSGPALENAFMAGVLTSGAECQDAGIIPTPTLGYATRHFDVGVMITASHNPPEYNGMKLWNPDGSAFSPEQEREIDKLVSSDAFTSVSWDKLKTAGVYETAIEEHIQRITQGFPAPLKVKVVVDCGGGAASVITPHLLRKLGCEVVEINCQPTGFFPRPSEPAESNLSELIRAVGEHGAHAGIAHDGDADRMMAVDDKGRFIPGDKLMAMLAQAQRAKEIYTTIDASMSIDEMGFKVRRTRVGDTAVSHELKCGGDFGGEPSGSWIFPHVSLCPDGIYAAAQIAAIASQHKLAELAERIPAYPIRRGSVSSAGVAISQLESKLTTLKPASMANTDGFKLNFNDGWLLIRPSGTEPKIRLTAEAKTEARAQKLYESGMDAIKSIKRGS